MANKMKLKVIGSGCMTCKKLYQWVLKLKEEGKIKADVEYSDDINELIELGAMASPALVKDGKLIWVGMPKSEEDLLEIIKMSSK